MSDESMDAIERDLSYEMDEEINEFNETGMDGVIIVHNTKYSEYSIKQVIRETEKAWYIEFNGGAKRWLPKSQVRIYDNTTMEINQCPDCEIELKNHTLLIPDWLVDKITELAIKNIISHDSKSNTGNWRKN